MLLIQIRARTAVGYGRNSTAVIIRLVVGKLTLVSKRQVSGIYNMLAVVKMCEYLVNYCALLASL